MIKIKEGLNSFYIENDLDTSTSVEAYDIIITNEFNNNNKKFELGSVYVNPRYIKFDLELVIDSDEDLLNKKIFLTEGLNKIKIYKNNTLIYTNILFVEYDINSDNLKYIENTDDTFVYEN